VCLYVHAGDLHGEGVLIGAGYLSLKNEVFVCVMCSSETQDSLYAIATV
jgi:hypothetical protein